MPNFRLAYTKTPASQPASGGVAYKANPSNYGNATTKVINLTNNTWLGDSVVFTVDSAWRYVVHVRNSHNGASSIHIDDVRVYGMNTATYLACDTASGGYRYGFGAQEKESDISGVKGGQLTYEYRIHDTRLGRFLSVDPLGREFPWNSPYAFAENDVVRCIDLEGREKVEVNGNIIKFSFVYGVFKDDGGPAVDVVQFNEIIKEYCKSNINGTYSLDEDVEIIAFDGSSTVLKACVYEFDVDIKVKDYSHWTYDDFMRESSDYDQPEFSGTIAFDKVTREGKDIDFNSEDPKAVGLTYSSQFRPGNDVILFKSSMFEDLGDNATLTKFKNTFGHEVFIHDVGISHEDGVYKGGIGNHAFDDKINKMNPDEFKGLFLPQLNTIEKNDEKIIYKSNRIRHVETK